MHGLSSGKLAKAAKVSIYTIRFYEKSGLLPQPSRRPSGFREYSDLDLLQLQFLRHARALGLSLDEIAALLAFEDESSATTSKRLIECKLAILDRRLAELEQWRRALRALASAPHGQLSRRHLLLHFSSNHVVPQDPDALASEPARLSRDSHG